MQGDGRTSPFPWEAVMAFGFGVLRLSSAAFWAMTPREMAAAMRAHGLAGAEAPGRSQLDALMAAFPDNEKERRNGE